MADLWKFGENETEWWYVGFLLMAFSFYLMRVWNIAKYKQEMQTVFDGLISLLRFFSPSQMKTRIRKQQRRTRRWMRKMLNEPPRKEEESTDDEIAPAKPRAEHFADKTQRLQSARIAAQKQKKLDEQKALEELKEKEVTACAYLQHIRFRFPCMDRGNAYCSSLVRSQHVRSAVVMGMACNI